MKRPALPLFVLLCTALCASLAHAQDAQKPAPPAAEAQKPRPAPGQPADPQIIEKIFNCLAPGLPKNWKKAWIVVNEIGQDEAGTTRKFEANFFFATNLKDSKGKKLTPCGSAPVLEGVTALNDYLPEKQRQWTGITLTFTSEGKFDATYDYTPRKPAPAAEEPARPAAKAKATKKSDSSSK
jgi:hypothetical protein